MSDLSIVRKRMLAGKDKRVRDIFALLLSDYEKRNGEMSIADLTLLGAWAEQEQMAVDVEKDIATNGKIVVVRNGRQSFRKENPSVRQLLAIRDSQRKLLSELRLTFDASDGVSSTKAAEIDDFDKF